MEKRIIKKINKNQRRLVELYRRIMKYTDIGAEMADSDSLLMLGTIAKIHEELTDIIYMIIDNENF